LFLKTKTKNVKSTGLEPKEQSNLGRPLDYALKGRLPSTEEVTHLHKPLGHHTLSEDIGLLEIGINLSQGNSAGVIDMTLEEMIVDPNVLGVRGHLHGVSSSNGSVVVLEHCGLDNRVIDTRKFHGTGYFQKEPTKRKEFSHCLTQSDVLGLCGAEGNLSLEL
jgi:hypothetical protein